MRVGKEVVEVMNLLDKYLLLLLTYLMICPGCCERVESEMTVQRGGAMELCW